MSGLFHNIVLSTEVVVENMKGLAWQWFTGIVASNPCIYNEWTCDPCNSMTRFFLHNLKLLFWKSIVVSWVFSTCELFVQQRFLMVQYRNDNIDACIMFLHFDQSPRHPAAAERFYFFLCFGMHMHWYKMQVLNFCFSQLFVCVILDFQFRLVWFGPSG